MTDEVPAGSKVPEVGVGARDAGPPIVQDPNGAPIIFFDGAPIFGHYNGIFHVTLAALRHINDAAGNITRDPIAVAFLRTNAQGLLSLRKAIDDALLIATPTQGNKN